MVGLSVHLLGPLEIDSVAGNHDLPGSIKAQELFCYLLLHRDRPVLRTALAYVLWADLDAARALKHLRQALWQLHSAVCRDDDRLLEITPRYVALRSGADLWLDIAEFERVFERIRGPASQHLGVEEAAAADRAIALYRGDLLDGFDFDWCILEREWLQSAYLSMLDRLMVYCEITGDYELGIDYGERILRVDRAREYTHRRLMYLHALLGNRTGALRQYGRCVAALSEELDVLPARSTVLLWEKVRAGVEIDRRSSALASGPLAPAGVPASPFSERIRRVQLALGDVQLLIQAEFLGIESETPR
ncbi:MAG: hypothetical protein M3354_07425 [Chloroflexota bacterium]|nr:hypothetical protein [Chloroflexota bacterium]